MRNVFEIIESVINRGDYDLTTMLNKIDKYHIESKITDEEKEDLYSLARTKAEGSTSADVFKKLAELEVRVRELEKNKTDSEQEPAKVDEYIPGKWYYNGDKVLEDGKTYACTAPEGVACVWSPKEYPSYWELIEA